MSSSSTMDYAAIELSEGVVSTLLDENEDYDDIEGCHWCFSTLLHA